MGTGGTTQLSPLDFFVEVLHEHTLKTIQKTQWNILGNKSSPRRISTGRLHALQRFHSPPINLIVFEAPYRITP